MSFTNKLNKVLLLEAKCPACGSEAYVGLNDVECTNPQCRHFKQSQNQQAVKTIEFLFGRGIGMWINGKEPDKEFSTNGESDNIKFSDCFFDGIEVHGVKFDTDPKDDVPTKVVIDYGGNKIIGHIANANAKPASAGSGGLSQITINLVNGDEIEADETQLYVLFKT